MLQTLDWRNDMAQWVKTLEAKTGVGLIEWNRRIRARRFHDAHHLRTWLLKHNVDGYAQQLLVMERFGYPQYVASTATDLIADQYADRLQLRPILDAIVDAAAACGPVVMQARKTFVALVAPRRTFARVQPTTDTRVDLGLRLDGQRPGGRLRFNPHDSMRVRIGLAAVRDVDSEAVAWLRRAYAENS
jgi:Domain of unknown function (DUF5655)